MPDQRASDLMANWDELQEELKTSTKIFEEKVKDFQERWTSQMESSLGDLERQIAESQGWMRERIEDAKRDDLLAEMKKINVRLERLEQMLPQEDDSLDDVVSPKIR